MPLTAKGKKLKSKFREQYGKKKGDSVFYAMENSGKLKKVVKARVGAAADQYGGSKSSSGGNGRDPSKQYETTKPKGERISPTGKESLQQQRTQALAAIKPSSTPQNKTIAIGLSLAAPFPGAGYAYKKAIDSTAMGFGRKKSTQPPKGGGGGREGEQKIIKPLVTPIQATKPIDTNLVSPKDNFFDFVSYKVGGLSGGVSYGPPPKKGPNPQVPPVKMKKGGYN